MLLVEQLCDVSRAEATAPRVESVARGGDRTAAAPQPLVTNIKTLASGSEQRMGKVFHMSTVPPWL
jgi:hypothetical protein